MHSISKELEFDDEILEINYVGMEDTIDINVTGDHIFYANDIATHNSAVEEVDYNQGMIAGGISKVDTADNVLGIFTSRAMREHGRYQLQLIKTRSSSGVGSKIDLEFDVNSLRISGLTEEEENKYNSQAKTNGLIDKIKARSGTVASSMPAELASGQTTSEVKADIQGSKLKSMLADLKNTATTKG